ncbi:hypothetical protein EQG49_01550 [Periweissella cryptocerci]|uniref:Uncharacterized protein n=1 Tax=Periweissella cryptocerci TaxID=2506420 RepID=A0A4V1AIE6_9LACO|nr:hypothetical protein [Periweissella cryptocerci]QBO35235.1 hypothetical protein EQG49_01550 [Periweissella cryptocerci]
MYQIDDRQKHNNVKFAQRKLDEDVRETGKRATKKFIREYANTEEVLALIATFNAREDVEAIKVTNTIIASASNETVEGE